MLPSTRDRDAMEKLASESAYGTPESLIAIVQLPRWPWSRTQRALQFLLWREDDAVPLDYRVTTHLPDAARAVPGWPWPAKRRRSS